MLPTTMNAVRKPGRLLSVVPVVLVLLFVALPTYAASPVAKGAQPPDATCPAGGQCFADVLPANPFYEFANRLYMQDIVTGYPCGGAGEPCDAQNRPYYRPGNTVTRQQMSKFVDQARRLPRIDIDTDTDLYPLRSFTGAANGYGVLGHSDSGYGVRGNSNSGYGVFGYSGTSWSGYFAGDIYVSGSCTGCAGPSRIDHPLDPENKYLYHSTVQSPDMKNVYDGVVTLDANGEAEVVLPEWFEALNKEYRYQLTTIGGFAPVYIAQEISDNHFKIAGGSAHIKVSWQVTGIRHDHYAEAHPVGVEEEKAADERGKYLHPTEWGQPESAGIDYEEQQKMQEQMQQAGER